MAHTKSPMKSRKRKNVGGAGAGADWTVMVYLAGDNRSVAVIALGDFDPG